MRYKRGQSLPMPARQPAKTSLNPISIWATFTTRNILLQSPLIGWCTPLYTHVTPSFLLQHHKEINKTKPGLPRHLLPWKDKPPALLQGLVLTPGWAQSRWKKEETRCWVCSWNPSHASQQENVPSSLHVTALLDLQRDNRENSFK